MGPYTIIAFSVNGYVSLTGFSSLPLFRWGRISSQQSRNPLRHESRYLPIVRAMSLKTFIPELGELSTAETMSEMQLAARRVTGEQCRQLLQLKRKSHISNCYEHNYNRLQSIEQHQAMQRARLTRTTILPLNAYDWREPNEKSPDDDILVNTVTLHHHVHWHSHFPEATSHGQVRLRRWGFRWTKSAYRHQLHDESSLTEEVSSGEAHLRCEWGYCDPILDVHLRFRRIRTAITASIPVDRIPIWSCGTTLTASLSLYRDGNRVSQWLAVGAHQYRDYWISRQFILHRSPVRGWGWCMQSKFGALTVPARN